MVSLHPGVNHFLGYTWIYYNAFSNYTYNYPNYPSYSDHPNYHGGFSAPFSSFLYVYRRVIEKQYHQPQWRSLVSNTRLYIYIYQLHSYIHYCYLFFICSLLSILPSMIDLYRPFVPLKCNVWVMQPYYPSILDVLFFKFDQITTMCCPYQQPFYASNHEFVQKWNKMENTQILQFLCTLMGKSR